MLALISKSKSDNILLEMHNFSERKHLTICIVNVSKRPLANKNDNKAWWGFQIISVVTIRHFSRCVDSCAVLSHSVVSHSLWSYGLQPARLLCPWGFSRQEYWSGLPCTPPGDLPKPGIELRSPALQADSLLSESPRKPKNSGMGSLSLLQGILLTQELNWGLLHCRQILNQLS